MGVRNVGLYVVMALVAPLVGSLTAACGSSRDGFDGTPPTTTGSAQPSGPDLGTHHAGVSVTIGGTVYAPNASLPLSNALVYVTTQAPAPIPDGAYCDECITLPDGSFAVSAADGTFEFTTELPKGDAFLVVQKGQFRRVRPITIEKEGALKISHADTTLPGRADRDHGDDTPKMAILKDAADFDKIDESLTKLGIADYEVKNSRAILSDLAELMKFHVVFIPCGMSADPQAANETAKDNLRQFVAAGGKLYVTDWSYEFVRQPFTGFLSWEGETMKLGSAASGAEWDAPATATDEGLADWLAATGDSKFDVQGNWTTINATNTLPGVDAQGNPIDVEPKVWVTASKHGVVHPTTVSFAQQCGRVLFSTYHTESGFGGSTTLLAQEKALLYVLLEVGVCVGDRPGVH